MKRAAAVILICASGAARAAETRREINIAPAGTNGVLNRARCTANTAFFTASWDFGLAVPVGTDLLVFRMISCWSSRARLHAGV